MDTINNGGIGPATALVTERFPFVSEFVRAVGMAHEGYAVTGGTFPAPHDGYVVGGYANAVEIRKGANRGEAQSAALLFADANRSRLSDGFALGFWVNDRGRTVLDLVFVHGLAAEASDAAHHNGEQAYWAVTAGREVRI
jgi:hypothetical protein